MISLVVVAIFLIWLARAAWRRPVFALVGIFLVWQFLLKVLSSVYLDMAGPVYSDEVMTEVGGTGSSAPLLVFFVWMPLAFLYFALRPLPSARPPLPERHLQRGGVTFGDLLIGALAVFVVALYADLLVRGNIPLFTGIDRFAYDGGIFHQFFLEFLFLVTFLLGYSFARTRLLTGAWDLRCVLLLFAFFVYLLLTGHRFGAFYVMTSYMCLTLSALWLARDRGWFVAPGIAGASILQRIVRSRVAVAVAALAALGVVSVAIINNLFVVRDYGEAAGEELFQRLFVQPVHLYWLTWDRLQAGEISDVGAALDFMFSNPFDATRNTGIQYLMLLTLGAERSASLIDQQSQLAGGYPEIIIELGGIWGGILLASIAALVMAFLYRLCVVSLCRGHFLTSVMAIYVCFGFLVFYVGGMINFLLTWTYWLKIAVLIAAFVADRLMEHYGKRLLPWVMLPRRAVRQHRLAGS